MSGTSRHATAVSCAFCAVVAGEAEAHRVLEEESVVAFLDIAPLFRGHVLVVPRGHVETLGDLPPNQLPELFEAVQRIARAVESPAGLGAHGSFVAMNNRVSQSVPHLHVHVVPRRRKDGLRGFFWPRVRYDDDSDMAEVAACIRKGLAG